MSRRCREHYADEGEEADLLGKLELRRTEAKGTGVYATRDLAKGEFVGVLAGRVIPDRRHARMAADWVVSSRYSMETADQWGAVYVVEPEEDGTRKLGRRYRNSFGHYMNEPAPGERLNVAWAHNRAYDPARIDCYTVKPVKKGRELLVHYGSQYERKYRAPFERPMRAWDPEQTRSSIRPNAAGQGADSIPDRS